MAKLMFAVRLGVFDLRRMEGAFSLDILFLPLCLALTLTLSLFPLAAFCYDEFAAIPRN